MDSAFDTDIPGVTLPSARHVGILVIHGIGDEEPYGTLDSFARGLYRHFVNSGPAGYKMAAEWKERGADPSHKQQSWTQAQIHFAPTRDSDAEKISAPSITMAEYYWSPATKGRLKDLDVLSWLIRTGLEPFRYLSENIQAMLETAEAQKRSKAGLAYDRSVIVLREFGRLAFLYLPLLVAMVALGVFLKTLPTLPGIVSGISLEHSHGAVALLAIVRLMVLFSLGGYFVGFYKWMRFRVSRDSRRFSWFTLSGAVAFAVLFLFGPVWLALRVFSTIHSPAPLGPDDPVVIHFAVIDHWIAIIDHWISVGLAVLSQWILLDDSFSKLFRPLLSLLIAALVRTFFVDFVGDVAIYTNLNQRSSNFATRSQILEECGHALTSLYLDLREQSLSAGGDFEIVIAAHSLGTVIAYDTLNDLFNRARIKAAPVGASETPKSALVDSTEICSHLGGLLTFGSPLNKIYYFFRDQSAAEELVRAQIIDGMHSFRLTKPAESLPGLPIAPVMPVSEELDLLAKNLPWINVWSSMDVVSGKLFFYRPSRQVHRPYIVPFPLSHLRYWTDGEMYRIFAMQLLGIPAMQPTSIGQASNKQMIDTVDLHH
jgi:hypothetical protein